MRTELFIDGLWRLGGGEAFAARDPATGDVVWQGAEANRDDVKAAVAAAKAAFPDWAATPLGRRVAIVGAFADLVTAEADLLAGRIALEMGKALWDARGEVQSVVGKAGLSIASQRERAGEKVSQTPFGETRLEHRPHGVLAVLGPFNFPAHLPNGHIMPALLAGNTVVFKPSEFTPGVGAMMASLWERVGLPKGVVNLVQGGGDVGRALVQSDGIAGVLFTGSAEAGAAIHRHFAGRPEVLLALEMGGNAPLIVWPPADAVAAANLIAHSAFITSGQRCTCARRLILPEGGFGDGVIAALLSLMGRLKVGRADEGPFLGPLVSEKAADRLMAFQAKLLAAGGRALRPMVKTGAFLTPGLVDMTGVQAPDEEAFGPLLQVYRVRTLKDGISIANATRFGLAAGVICDDPAVWETARDRLRSGVLNWNRPTTGASGALPFGGLGASGNLRPSAAYAADYCAYPVSQQTAPKAEALPAPGLAS